MYTVQKIVKSKQNWKDMKTFKEMKDAILFAKEHSKGCDIDIEGDKIIFLGTSGLNYYEFRIINNL